MGDRSPKSKQRDQKQKTVAKAKTSAEATLKQAKESAFSPAPGKGKR